MITQQAESTTKHGMADEDTINLNIAIERAAEKSKTLYSQHRHQHHILLKTLKRTNE